MATGNNVNHISALHVSVTVDTVVRQEYAKFFYRPLRSSADRPALGEFNPESKSTLVITNQPRSLVPNLIYNTARLSVTAASVQIDRNQPGSLFVSGSVTEPSGIMRGLNFRSSSSAPNFKQNHISNVTTVVTNSTIRSQLFLPTRTTPSAVQIDRNQPGSLFVSGSVTEPSGIMRGLNFRSSSSAPNFKQNHISSVTTVVTNSTIRSQLFLPTRTTPSAIITEEQSVRTNTGRYQISKIKVPINNLPIVGLSVTLVSILGANSYGMGTVAVPVTGNENQASIIGAGPLSVGAYKMTHRYSTVITPSSNVIRPTADHVANEFTEPIFVYVLAPPSVRATQQFGASTDKNGIAATAVTHTVTESSAYTRSSLPLNAFSITYGNRPLTRQNVSNIQVNCSNVIRPTADHVANEFTEPIFVYVLAPPSVRATQQFGRDTNKNGIAATAVTYTVTESSAYTRSSLPLNAFSITYGNRPLTKHNVSNIQVNCSVLDLKKCSPDVIEKLVVVNNLVDTKARLIYVNTGASAGSSRSATAAPYGTAAVFVPGDGQLAVGSNSEFWY